MSRRIAPTIGGVDGGELRAIAPEAFAAWDVVRATTPAALPAEDDRACRIFASQFAADVGAITDEQRAAALAVLGADAFGFVQVLYVRDFGARMQAALSQLFDADAGPHDAAPATDLWSALDAFMAAVARLDALDPVTTEVVRLRGARAHKCRLCQSLRSARAARDGADESVYDEIDRYETSALPERHKVALRLVDAMLWEPLAHPRGLRDQIERTFSPAETVEIVLDVTRNAANKIAVALGADAAHVGEGVEFYEIDDAGQLVYGVKPPPSGSFNR